MCFRCARLLRVLEDAVFGMSAICPACPVSYALAPEERPATAEKGAPLEPAVHEMVAAEAMPLCNATISAKPKLDVRNGYIGRVLNLARLRTLSQNGLSQKQYVLCFRVYIYIHLHMYVDSRIIYT